MKNTLLLAVRFIAGVLVTFATTLVVAQQPTAVEQPFEAPATIPAGNREVVKTFAERQVNYGSVRILRNGEMVDLLDATPGKLTFESGFDQTKVVDRMTLVMKYYIKNCKTDGVQISAEETYSFLVELQARYQVGTGVLDPKGSVIGTALRDIKSTTFHLQKVGDAWTIPSEGYGFTLDWFRPDNSVLVGIPAIGVKAIDISLVGYGSETCVFRQEGWQISPEMFMICTRQLSGDMDMLPGIKGWLTLWYDEGAGVRVNYDLRTGSRIPWGHDKVPKLGISRVYPGSAFISLANLEFGQTYTVVSATSVTDTKTNVVGTFRVDKDTGDPVFLPIGSGDSSGFFGVRPATRDELPQARTTSSLKSN